MTLIRLYPCGYMETPLLLLVFHITFLLLFQISKHLAQNLLQCFRLYRFIVAEILKPCFVISDIRYIKGSGIAMRRIGNGIRIARLLQPLYIFLRSQHRGNNNLIRIQTFTFQRIQKILAYHIQ